MSKTIDCTPTYKKYGLELLGDEHSMAMFSKDRKYRYTLARLWDDNLPRVMFIGLNPSKADEKSNDPTIRRCINFAKSWGYGGMYMCNLFAYVSTDPRELLKSEEKLIINDEVLKSTSIECDKVIFCWGAFKQAQERARAVIPMFENPYCIEITQEGIPRHPLYLPAHYKPKRFTALPRPVFVEDSTLIAKLDAIEEKFLPSQYPFVIDNEDGQFIKAEFGAKWIKFPLGMKWWDALSELKAEPIDKRYLSVMEYTNNE